METKGPGHQGLQCPVFLRTANGGLQFSLHVNPCGFLSSVLVGVSAGIWGNMYLAALLVTQSGFVLKG